jgi:hypothetical protein
MQDYVHLVLILDLWKRCLVKLELTSISNPGEVASMQAVEETESRDRGSNIIR